MHSSSPPPHPPPHTPHPTHTPHHHHPHPARWQRPRWRQAKAKAKAKELEQLDVRGTSGAPLSVKSCVGGCDAAATHGPATCNSQLCTLLIRYIRGLTELRTGKHWNAEETGRHRRVVCPLTD